MFFQVSRLQMVAIYTCFLAAFSGEIGLSV